jgi:hypothetical protein
MSTGCGTRATSARRANSRRAALPLRNSPTTRRSGASLSALAELGEPAVNPSTWLAQLRDRAEASVRSREAAPPGQERGRSPNRDRTQYPQDSYWPHASRSFLLDSHCGTRLVYLPGRSAIVETRNGSPEGGASSDCNFSGSYASHRVVANRLLVNASLRRPQSVGGR